MFEVNEINILNKTEDEHGFYSLASEFLEAAKILDKQVITNIKVNSASIYLTCHAGELFLKSYLLKSQGDEVFFKNKYRHNINKLISHTSLINPSIKLNLLESIAKVYENKQLEYRQNTYLTLVSTTALINEISELSKVVFEKLAYNGNKT